MCECHSKCGNEIPKRGTYKSKREAAIKAQQKMHVALAASARPRRQCRNCLQPMGVKRVLCPYASLGGRARPALGTFHVPLC